MAADRPWASACSAVAAAAPQEKRAALEKGPLKPHTLGLQLTRVQEKQEIPSRLKEFRQQFDTLSPLHISDSKHNIAREVLLRIRMGGPSLQKREQIGEFMARLETSPGLACDGMPGAAFHCRVSFLKKKGVESHECTLLMTM